MENFLNKQIIIIVIFLLFIFYLIFAKLNRISKKMFESKINTEKDYALMLISSGYMFDVTHLMKEEEKALFEILKNDFEDLSRYHDFKNDKYYFERKGGKNRKIYN